MKSTEIKIDIEPYQKEVDSFESGKSSIEKLKYKVSLEEQKMCSTDTVLKCADVMNSIFISLGLLDDKILREMNNIRDTWLDLDKKHQGMGGFR